MRHLLPLVLFLAVGCQHCPRFFDCNPSCVEKEVCKEEIVECPPTRVKREKPCPKKEVCEVPCEKPAKECKEQETIHIKLPPQKIIVQQQQAAPQAQAMMAQPQAMTAQPQAFAMMPASAVESQAVGRARLGMTFDFVRVPIPFPRLIAVPTQQRMQAVPVAMTQGFAAPQAMMAQPQAMMAQPQAMMQQAAPTHGIVRTQGLATVPVTTHAVVPFEQHAIVPLGAQVQSFGVQPQGMMVQPQGVMVQPQAAVAPQQMQGISLEQARQFCEMVERMKKQTGN